MSAFPERLVVELMGSTAVDQDDSIAARAVSTNRP